MNPYIQFDLLVKCQHCNADINEQCKKMENNKVHFSRRIDSILKRKNKTREDLMKALETGEPLTEYLNKE